MTSELTPARARKAAKKRKTAPKPQLTNNDLVAQMICRAVYSGRCGCHQSRSSACDAMLSAARSARAMILMQETRLTEERQ